MLTGQDVLDVQTRLEMLRYSPGPLSCYGDGRPEVYQGDGRFVAIVGNTSVTNKSNGGEVARATRHLTQVDGFIRIP